MKRAILLATVALLAMLVLVPMAMAQDTTMMMGGTTMMMEQTGGQMMGGTTMMEMTSGQMAQDDLPTSGGPAILLPAAALLVGSGILTYAILRRR
ncbi:hypothetical protein GBA63_03135 [Rubrobacter tropicus]|uniref:LPXTG cell wall anchor domain-containing protein n=1 Tax=Rubrobacter tropicus TaxID=2653851 RepID=A0A6G8Q5J2_9ACTN|nr:hypothetical protein [Rubrobacter tropicus]QIN81741.1 hypothetical protein GBA63_03135 [Rubrobacter tropicus]